MSTTHLSKAEAGAGSFFFSSLGPLRLSRLSRLLLLLSPIINLVTNPHSSSHIIPRLCFPFLFSLNSPPYSLLEASQLPHIHLNKMQLTASKNNPFSTFHTQWWLSPSTPCGRCGRSCRCGWQRWTWSSGAHAAAPAGPAALASAGRGPGR